MGRAAGTGSPVWFRCYRDRRGEGTDHTVQVTGRTRPSRIKGVVGSRSTFTDREYVCSCGHIGWSNHRDLEGMVP